MDVSALEGQELQTVAFTEDFLELRFADGPLVTLYEWPSVILAEYSVSYGEPEYRNQLCAQIGEEVESAELEEGGTLTVKFASGNVLALSLREEDLSGPEAGSYSESGHGDDTLEF